MITENTMVDNLLDRIQSLEEENEECNVLIHAANEKLKELRRVKKMTIRQFIKWRRK